MGRHRNLRRAVFRVGVAVIDLGWREHRACAEFWGARAPRTLVMAPRHRELFLPSQGKESAAKSSFWRGAKTGTQGACAPRKVPLALLPIEVNTGL
jgi:hypothetical protein